MKNANPVSFLWRVAVLAAAMSLAAGCGRSDVAREPAGAPKTVNDFFTIEVGGRPVRMQLAVRDREKARGLMERRDLKPDEGMLFLYEHPEQMSFWMRNTPTPLDIGFFSSDGVLREVYPLHPYDETPVRSVGTGLRFALEVNQGWFGFHGVKPGAKLDFNALAKALRARGFDPAAYGVK